MECCACGEPYKLKDGQTNLARFDVDPVPQVTRDIQQATCRKCARRIAAAWAKKMGPKVKPRGYA